MEHEETKEEFYEEDKWWKGPIKWIIAIFLLLIIVTWIIPEFAIKPNPSPKNIPSLEDVSVYLGDFEINETFELKGREDFVKFVDGSDTVVKRAADYIATRSCGGEKVCYAKAIHYFVRDNFDYVNDPLSFEYVKTARESLKSRGGDCDDGAVLTASLAQAVGIDVRLVFVIGHVYVQMKLPEALNSYKDEDDWVNVDVTCSNCEFGKIPVSSIKKEKSFLDV